MAFTAVYFTSTGIQIDWSEHIIIARKSMTICRLLMYPLPFVECTYVDTSLP